jgi:bacteriocin-like protein
MKNLNLQEMNLQEMSIEEMQSVEGGGFLCFLGSLLIAIGEFILSLCE